MLNRIEGLVRHDEALHEVQYCAKIKDIKLTSFMVWMFDCVRIRH